MDEKASIATEAGTYYDGIAQGYDTLYGEEQYHKMSIIKKHISNSTDSKILDIGCGSGISSDIDCTVIGVDPSAKLIKLAQKKYKNDSRKEFYAHDHNYIHLQKDKSIDYVFCISAVHHIPDIDDFLLQVKRVSKKAVITILKKIAQKEMIIKSISQHLVIDKEIEEDKDIILFCSC